MEGAVNSKIALTFLEHRTDLRTWYVVAIPYYISTITLDMDFVVTVTGKMNQSMSISPMPNVNTWLI